MATRKRAKMPAIWALLASGACLPGCTNFGQVAMSPAMPREQVVLTSVSEVTPHKMVVRDAATGELRPVVSERITRGDVQPVAAKSMSSTTQTVAVKDKKAKPASPPPADVPNEKSRMALPVYVIEPPDVIKITAVQLAPRGPYKLKALDAVNVQFPADPEDLKKEEIDELVKAEKVLKVRCSIDTEGKINLGPIYGRIQVKDMQVEQARDAVESRIRQLVRKELVDAGKTSVTLGQSRALQQILGNHQVRADGTIGLGTYGNVYVTGLSLDMARQALEQHLSKYVQSPEIAVDVSTCNSKVYYVIHDNGSGERIFRVRVTGNETVLDAISKANIQVPAKGNCKIWIARPGAADSNKEQVLNVDWNAVAHRGVSRANYQVFPGDRIYVRVAPVQSSTVPVVHEMPMSVGTMPTGNVQVMPMQSTSMHPVPMSTMPGQMVPMQTGNDSEATRNRIINFLLGYDK